MILVVETQVAFIDAAKDAGVPHLVKLSGKESGIGFDPDRFRGTREHVEIERYLEASGLAWTHLRPSQFMNRYLPGALTGVDPRKRELRLPIGDIRLSPIESVAVDDNATGVCLGRDMVKLDPVASRTTEDRSSGTDRSRVGEHLNLIG
jgi:uncharacterized protein YbjT (DUF2867 family)